jgi:hypothetical protein
MILGIGRRHSPGLCEAAVKSRLSTGGRYMAVTFIIEAMSQGWLDARLARAAVTSAS